jgi:hypothetical protein
MKTTKQLLIAGKKHSSGDFLKTDFIFCTYKQPDCLQRKRRSAMEKCGNDGCCVVKGYENPGDPEEQAFDIGGENYVKGKINRSKKMIVDEGLQGLANSLANHLDENEEPVPEDSKMIGRFSPPDEFPGYVMWKWAHALDVDNPVSLEDLLEINWTNNLDSTVDYKEDVGMMTKYALALVENVRLHYKKPIFTKYVEEICEFYI